jgi:hypothetical protein
MKPISPRRQPSQSILRFFAALVICAVVPVMGTSAGTRIVDRQDRSAMRLTGVLTDTTCGNTHGRKTQDSAECIRLCVKLGAEYALAVGDRIYALRGHQAELNTFAGDMVVVKGRIVNHKTVAVESVDPYTVWARFFKN